MKDLYAVFGNPVAHSKSPQIHEFFAKQTGQDMHYQTRLAALDGFEHAVRQFIAQGGRGANVTLPFKEQAFALCDEVSDYARQANAVNTLSILPDGRLLGDNTDGRGLIADLLAVMSLKHKRILLIGAGGAARGCIGPLLACQPAALVICNRTQHKAEQLASLFQTMGPVTAEPIAELKAGFDLVINSTSASLNGQLPAIPSAVITEKTLCYDMMYGAELTAFNHWAKEQGAQEVRDGLGMLVGQAAISFEIWRGVRPGTESLIALLRNQLESQ
ncbi:shikimate dehydrogenase (NADP(+)) [Shewanella sp. NFH-SH190041]|uniref:shikimate dehydrogenase n=1 Tax=Shewanella sp. NFH-SH190041 TaxID=2950245 RepID=UPI0021C3A827|nr:shikimate dehydrogenase [Shewanella sp. NFH-SH190041]BDM62577.1 shikimate dehydrogenase (NADP(+)) [Shewanella sp. NFH-SH190041]